MKLLKKFFPSLFTISQSEINRIKKEAVNEYKEKEEERKIENLSIQYETYPYVVCISNEWQDITVGEVIRFETIGKSTLPVVYDVMTSKEFLCFGIVRTYSEDLVNTLYKLDPYEQYLVASNSYAGKMTKEKSGEVKFTSEQIIAKMNTHIKQKRD